jgi:hypothetical protein
MTELTIKEFLAINVGSLLVKRGIFILIKAWIRVLHMQCMNSSRNFSGIVPRKQASLCGEFLG